jgi:hypothetical protein
LSGGNKGKPLSDVALNKALATAGGGAATVHGNVAEALAALAQLPSTVKPPGRNALDRAPAAYGS